MIKLTLKWALTRMKVNIRSIAFWLMTVMTALALLLTHRVIGEYSSCTRVLLCIDGTEGDTDFGEWCLDYMTAHTPECFEYETVESADELIRRVSTGEESCGVVFGDTDRISIYQTAGSVDGFVVREIVYPAAAMYRSPGELGDYIRGLYPALSGDVLNGTADEAVSYVTDRYMAHMDELDLELFEIRDMSGDTDREYASGSSDARFRQRAGVLTRTVSVLMLILICGMCIYDTFYTDRVFYRSFSPGRRMILACTHIMITVVMSVVFAWVLTLMVNGGIRF
ncbi:MAG: hypothetical protein K5673_05415 [Lachnospiraceae bacterium]|nr:hypothetical protein [Lachnospiraceae bacterium]